MLIKITNYLKKYSLILLFIVLILRILLLLLSIQRNNEAEKVTFDYYFAGSTETCAIYNDFYVAYLPDCNGFQKGSLLRIIGREDKELANEFWPKKKIDVLEIKTIYISRASFYYWFINARQLFLNIRGYLQASIMRYFSYEENILAVGMLMGTGGSNSEKLRQQFKIIGMQHVMAVSGYNVAMIGGLATLISCRFGRFKQFFIWILVLLPYIFMTDLSASVVRAFVSAVLGIIGKNLFFRQKNNLYLLFLTSWLMLMLKPIYIFNISFQLSMTATLGIILFMPIFSTADFWSNLSMGSFDLSSLPGLKIFYESLLNTVAAQVFTLPILLYHFVEFSILSLVANTFLLWLTPLITLGALFFISQSLFLGRIYYLQLALSWFLLVPLKLFLRGVAFFAQYQQLFFSGIKFNLSEVTVWCLGAILLYIYLKKNYVLKSI